MRLGLGLSWVSLRSPRIHRTYKDSQNLEKLLHSWLQFITVKGWTLKSGKVKGAWGTAQTSIWVLQVWVGLACLSSQNHTV